MLIYKQKSTKHETILTKKSSGRAQKWITT